MTSRGLCAQVECAQQQSEQRQTAHTAAVRECRQQPRAHTPLQGLRSGSACLRVSAVHPDECDHAHDAAGRIDPAARRRIRQREGAEGGQRQPQGRPEQQQRREQRPQGQQREARPRLARSGARTVRCRGTGMRMRMRLQLRRLRGRWFPPGASGGPRPLGDGCGGCGGAVAAWCTARSHVAVSIASRTRQT